MNIYLDPWNPEFVPSLQAEAPEERTAPRVQLDVERSSWEAVSPDSLWFPGFVFVDGVRRVDARIILQKPGGSVLYGLLGSIAAGAVSADRERVNASDEILDNVLLERYLITGGGESPWQEPVSVSPGFQYQAVSVPEEEVQAPLHKLHQLMRDAEGKLLSLLAERKAESVLVADGPLQFPWARKTAAVGYIKSFHEWYLPLSHLDRLQHLKAGERSPLFLISGEHATDRYGWFVRLAIPESGDAPLSGLARLEVSAESGVEAARKLANATCSLAAFVSSKYRDPRSPQNLLPIGALEKTLKHLLGDAGLLKRWIQSWIRRMQA